MIINHNMASLNTYRQLSANNVNSSKSLEKLSSGLRINRAGDDAAGLAISEKMRGQIRGLDQAARNSQDAISLIQTAEGGLSETHSILQRMKELATQAASDTNVGADRSEIQKEINQLSSEINRIGNTTEFNTQKLLKGDGGISIDKTGVITDAKLAGGATTNTQVSQATKISTAAAANDTMTFTLNGQELKVTFAASGAAGETDLVAYNATSNSATVNIDAAMTVDDTAAALKSAVEKMIAANDTLRGNFTASAATDTLTIAATAGGAYAGSAGSIAAVTKTGTIAAAASGLAAVGTTTSSFATSTIDLSAIDTVAEAQDLVGKGITINGTRVEFYNSNNGAYTGNAQGIDISDAIEAAAGTNDTALAKAISTQAKIDGVSIVQGAGAADNTVIVTATTGGTAGNEIAITDGGIQKNYEATFQVGANKGQSFSIEIADMRSMALGVTGTAGSAGFASSNNVTNGTDSTTREAALDVSSYETATAAIKTVEDAISKVSAERSKLGAFQNRLEHTINNLGTSSENLTAAESRVRDVDMAKEMMNFQKNNILSQAAQAMLAQANQQPQGVLQLLR